MEIKPVYITAKQAKDITIKLNKHLDDLLTDIRQQVTLYLEDIVQSYLPDDNDNISQKSKRKKSSKKTKS